MNFNLPRWWAAISSSMPCGFSNFIGECKSFFEENTIFLFAPRFLLSVSPDVVGVENELSSLLELGLEEFGKDKSSSSENLLQNVLLFSKNFSNLLENGEARWSKSFSLKSNLLSPVTAFRFLQITLKRELSTSVKICMLGHPV